VERKPQAYPLAAIHEKIRVRVSAPEERRILGRQLGRADAFDSLQVINGGLGQISQGLVSLHQSAGHRLSSQIFEQVGSARVLQIGPNFIGSASLCVALRVRSYLFDNPPVAVCGVGACV
jgi:hypothetical protein